MNPQKKFAKDIRKELNKIKKKLTAKEKVKLINKLKKTKKKDIVFHEDFSKGERIALCNTCGYAQNFAGFWDYPCDNCGHKMQVYSNKKFQDFIFKLQRIAERNYKKYNENNKNNDMWIKKKRV